jgi:hypothetical protein
MPSCEVSEALSVRRFPKFQTQLSIILYTNQTGEMFFGIQRTLSIQHCFDTWLNLAILNWIVCNSKMSSSPYTNQETLGLTHRRSSELISAHSASAGYFTISYALKMWSANSIIAYSAYTSLRALDERTRRTSRMATGQEW